MEKNEGLAVLHAARGIIKIADFLEKTIFERCDFDWYEIAAISKYKAMTMYHRKFNTSLAETRMTVEFYMNLHGIPLD